MSTDSIKNDIAHIKEFATYVCGSVVNIIYQVNRLLDSDDYKTHFEKILESNVTLQNICDHFRYWRQSMTIENGKKIISIYGAGEDIFKIILPKSEPKYVHEINSQIDKYINFIEEYQIDPQFCLDVYTEKYSPIKAAYKEPYLEYILNRCTTLTLDKCLQLLTQDDVLCFESDTVVKLIYDRIDFKDPEIESKICIYWSVILSRVPTNYFSKYGVGHSDNFEYILAYFKLFEDFLSKNDKALIKLLTINFNNCECNQCKNVLKYCSNAFIAYGVQVDFITQTKCLLGSESRTILENITPELFVGCGFQTSLTTEQWVCNFFIVSNHQMINSGLFSDMDIINAIRQKPHIFVCCSYLKNNFVDNLQFADKCADAILEKLKHFITLYVEAGLEQKLLDKFLENFIIRPSYIEIKYQIEIFDHIFNLSSNIQIGNSVIKNLSRPLADYFVGKGFGEKIDQTEP
jgi:hypothetical protein